MIIELLSKYSHLRLNDEVVNTLCIVGGGSILSLVAFTVISLFYKVESPEEVRVNEFHFHMDRLLKYLETTKEYDLVYINETAEKRYFTFSVKRKNGVMFFYKNITEMIQTYFSSINCSVENPKSPYTQSFLVKNKKGEHIFSIFASVVNIVSGRSTCMIEAEQATH